MAITMVQATLTFSVGGGFSHQELLLYHIIQCVVVVVIELRRRLL
jgi:uncharacterized membrane protein